MSSPEQTNRVGQESPAEWQPIGLRILDWLLIVSAVASSAVALLGSRTTTLAEAVFEISQAAVPEAAGLRIEIDATNQVKLAGQPIQDVPSLVDRIEERSEMRQATIAADEEALFATTDWVATTLINSGVDRVQIVTSRRVEATE